MTDDIQRHISESLSRAFDHSAFLELGDVEPSTEPMPEFQVNKIAIRVDERILPGWSPDQLSPAERAIHDARMARYDAWKTEQRAVHEAARIALGAIKESGVRAVLALHGRVETNWDDECAHCYSDTEMGDHEDWPCETVRAIAHAYDIPIDVPYPTEGATA